MKEADAMRDTIAQEKQKYATLSKKMETMARIGRDKIYVLASFSHTFFCPVFLIIFFFLAILEKNK